MKLALSWFCLLHLACLVTAGLFRRGDPQDGNVTAGGSRARAPQRAGNSYQGRQRPLFARRGQYERQRIHVPKPKEAPAPPNELPAPSRAPAKSLKCSQLTQSCLPQSGCCDPQASCHCRFFNTICFCRKSNLSYKKKT